MHSPQESTDDHSRDESLPTIFVVGGSVAAYHEDVEHQGAASIQGWGPFLGAFFDPSKVHVVSAAASGTSARTYFEEGRWDNIRKRLKPRDIVLIQFGNDETIDPHATIPGMGEQTSQIADERTHRSEAVHTFGWYIRVYIRETKARGAVPIVLSVAPRNVWTHGRIERGPGEYRLWARSVALEEQNTDFVDMSGIIAREYEKLGQVKASGLYHDLDLITLSTPGAYLSAQLTVSGLKALLDDPVCQYLSPLGTGVTPADELAFHWPPHNSPLPTLWLLGDSTMRNGDGTGMGGLWGWGDELAGYFDTTALNIVNAAVSGRSSRTFYAKHWPFLLPNIRKGDFVLIQFGHNELGDPADHSRERATLPGIGPEEKTIHNVQTGRDEVVHTYGWYVRRIIAEAREHGAVPILCSPIPRNSWDQNHIRREPPVAWSAALAHEEEIPFLDLNTRIASYYETIGRQETTALFADGGTHTTLDGAKFNARSATEEIKAADIRPLRDFIR